MQIDVLSGPAILKQTSGNSGLGTYWDHLRMQPGTSDPNGTWTRLSSPESYGVLAGSQVKGVMSMKSCVVTCTPVKCCAELI